MKIDCLKAAEMLRGMDDILILTHRRPDGDTVGCGAALCTALRESGKTAWIFENTDLTERYFQYFEGMIAPADFEPKHVVTVDTASVGMLCPGGEKYTDSIELAIDHHGSNEGYAQYFWVDATAAACGEMVLKLTLELCGKLPQECLAPLYLAISTDTGCFQYTNTTADTFRAAACLLEGGVDAYAINKVMFGTKSMSRLKLESLLTAGMEFFSGGKVCVMTLTMDMMERSGATDNDIDDLAGFPRVVEGVDVGILLRELTAETSKASVRTAGKANASEICRPLGGGGHPGAAGVSMDATYSELKELLLDSVEKA